MYKKTLLSLAVASTLTLTGCLDTGKDGGNGDPDYKITNPVTDGLTYPLFNPLAAESVDKFPIPNDLMFEATNPLLGTVKDGTLGPSSALAALDYLDGNSTSAPLDVKFSAPLDSTTVDSRAFIPHPDPAQGGVLIPNPTQNVFLLDLTYPGGDELSSTTIKDADNNDVSLEVPTFEAGILYKTYVAKFTVWSLLGQPTTGTEFDEKEDAEEALLRNVDFRAEVVQIDGTESFIRISPRSPLNPESKYLVVITNEIQDSQGKAIGQSSTYTSVTDPNVPLGSSSFAPVEAAALGWEKLASGWFGAATNGSRTAFGMSDLSADNIALSLTFTTGGTESVLKSMAAPEIFFIKKATIEARQAGITSLATGQLTLSASEMVNIPPANVTLNTYFLGAVTTAGKATYIEALDPTDPNGNYDSTLLYFSDLTDSTDQFKAETAAAEANASIVRGDPTPFDGTGTNLIVAASTTTGQLIAGGVLQKPSSGITDKDGSNTITVTDIFLPVNPAGTGLGVFSLPSSAVLGATAKPGNIMQGQIELQDYLPDASLDSNKSNVEIGTWKANDSASLGAPSDKVTYRFPFAGNPNTQNVPFLLSLPDEATMTALSKPIPAKWPIVIYQHGIFGSRAHSLPMANALGAGCLASAVNCFATIAIDMPLHGIGATEGNQKVNSALALSVDVDAANSLAPRDWSGTPYAGLHERHYGWSKTSDLDSTPTAMSYSTELASADGFSGEYYINLALPPASRDNLRQSSLDLMTLVASLKDIDLNGDGVGDLDTTKVYFVGHSLGGIVGTTFAATNNDTNVLAFNPGELVKLQAVSLQTTGGQITRILENSPSLGSKILEGLALAGVAQGSSSFEIFMNTAQAATDSGDSINFANSLRAGSTPILATEIYGDGSDRDTQDQTIPINTDSVDGAYLAQRGTALNTPLGGTEPLLRELGLDNLTTPGLITDANGIEGVVRFNTGSHTSIITVDNLTVFTEMATQLASFFSSNGLQVAVGATVDSDGNPTAAVISNAEPDVSN